MIGGVVGQGRHYAKGQRYHRRPVSLLARPRLWTPGQTPPIKYPQAGEPPASPGDPASEHGQRGVLSRGERSQIPSHPRPAPNRRQGGPAT